MYAGGGVSVHPRELLADIVDKEVVVKQKELLVEAKFELCQVYLNYF